ncbi:MAG: hypothetical protein JXB50_02465 [Spirochaetes bacterium]|nr:hypothetical protein [Spirochaetota bacterium]
MKKIIIIIIILNNLIILYSNIKLENYNLYLQVPSLSENIKDETSDKPPSFSFRIGKIDGDIKILGYWKIKLGYAFGFTVYPDELKWILTYPGIVEGIIFDQSRLFSLDWTTTSGIYFHLFFNDNAEDTEFTFKYKHNRFFNSLYITNKPDEIQVNSFRELKGGRPQDINFGFDWGNRFYKGRFDVQFDSVKPKVDKFKGNSIEIDDRLLSNQYERGLYYYLPDKNLTSSVEVYLHDPKIITIDNPDLILDNGKKCIKLMENYDYVIDYANGFLKLRESSYNKLLIIFYEVNVNGSIYKVGYGDPCGINGVYGNIDFNATDFSDFNDYFTSGSGKDYLILSFINEYSVFEEKNSYKIANPNSKITRFNADIYTKNNNKETGFKITFDEFTGCLRVSKSSQKGTFNNIYPFYDYVDPVEFYSTFYTPTNNLSTHMIDFICYLRNKELKLTNKPVFSSIKVFYNTLLLDQSKYYYDQISQSITVNFDVLDSDIIEVYYLTEEEDSYNLTFALKNQFRINKYLIIGDSLWYKMPIKLWEDSYYNKMHSMELLYFVNLTSDFSSMLTTKNSKLGFDLSAGFSMYHPELKGVTLIEDFEQDLKGKKLDMHYSNWYPVNIPPDTIFADMTGATKGRIFYRNMHKYGQTEGVSFLSIYDNEAPDRDNYTNGANIGPYSSSDGFTYNYYQKDYTDKTNTLSLITEFELDPGEAVSIVIPVSSMNELIDFSKYNGLNIALKRASLSGEVRLYIDGGKVSEEYNTGDSLIQEETLDEGIRYYIDESGGFYMYKGKNDGRKSTNDFNGNGILDGDDISQITRFINTETSNYYYEITDKYNNINFSIEDNQRLKSLRGIRLTLYSPTTSSGASGRFIINQIRFIESGWDYDKVLLNSEAAEISPVEDDYLLDHIFSVKNSEIDSKLHFQRFRERTLRINLIQNERFYIEKEFSYPIDISNFNKLSMFILLKDETRRRIEINLKDTDGKNIQITKSLDDLSNNRWHKLDFYFNTFDHYSKCNKLINKIKIQFTNESTDTADNVIYMDEFFMDEAVPSFGFGTKNSFNYHEPELTVLKKDFTVFSSPYLQWNILFNTKNFLKEELIKSKDHALTNDITFHYTLTEINYFLNTKLDFIFREDGVYNSGEELTIKLNRFKNKISPVTFLIFYDYSKTNIFDANLYTDINNKNEDRKLTLESGSDFEKIKFNIGYDINSNKRTFIYTTSSFYANYNIKIYDLFQNTNYRITSSLSGNNLEGFFSLDNLAYLFKNDFIKFFDHGEYKEQELNLNSGGYLIKPVFFTHNFLINFKGNNIFTNDIYNFILDYYNSIQFNVILKYLERENSFFIIKYQRNVSNNYSNYYKTIYWQNYFNEFNTIINNTTPVFFFPPFSSLYKSNNKTIYSDSIKYDLLKDNIFLKWDWSIYLNNIYFIPNSFYTDITEKLTNSTLYTSSYILKFGIESTTELGTNLFTSTELNYSTEFELTLDNIYNTYKTDNMINFNFNTSNNIDFESSFIHSQIIYDGYDRKISEHNFILIFLIYKSFYKRNVITYNLYGFDMSYQLEIKSNFHIRFDNLPVFKIDNPIDLLFTTRLGYKFNKNFSLFSQLKFGYSVDYSQLTLDRVNRFGGEASLEGIFTF